MPSPFPGMDPYLEANPIFQELHTQILAEAQALLQPQLRPKYVARLERHLSEGSLGTSTADICRLREPFPLVPVPLLGSDQARLDLGACFRSAYDRIAADEDVDYSAAPPPPALSADDEA